MLCVIPDQDSSGGGEDDEAEMPDVICAVGEEGSEVYDVFTMYKRQADKVRPVDDAPSDGSVPKGDVHWRERRWNEAKGNIVTEERSEFRDFVTPRFSTKPEGHRLTPDRMAEIVKKLPASMTDIEKELFQRIMMNREAALAWDFEDIGSIHPDIFPPQEIRTIPHGAWQARSIPVPKSLREEVDKILKEKIENGLLERSHSAYRNPWFLVAKKNKKYRLINNATRINAVTIRDAFTAPAIDEFVDDFVGQKLHTVADFFSGYDQISLHPESRDLTAFETTIGLLRSTTLPQGATNSVAQFQRGVVTLLDDLVPSVARPFVDDVAIRGPKTTYNNEEVSPGLRRYVAEHLRNVDRVLVNFELAGATAAAEKSQWCQEKVDLVGFTLTPEGRLPEQGKVWKIEAWPVCTNTKDVRMFMGLVVFYRLWIDHFAVIAKPLYNLLKKNARFTWTSVQQIAFDKLKKMMSSPPVLIGLNYGPGAGDIILSVDASLTGWGAVLSQMVGNERKPARFESGMWSDPETRYDATKRECRGVAYALRRLRSCLYGTHFILETDAMVLVHQLNGALDDVPGSLIIRWVTWIRSFDFTVRHISGTKNVVADALSRRPDDGSSDQKSADNVILEDFIEAQIFYQEIQDHGSELLDPSEQWSQKSQEMAAYLTRFETPQGLSAKNRRRFIAGSAHFAYRDRLLWRRPQNKEQRPMRVVDDQDKRRELIRIAHREAAHRGREATMGKLKNKYWWPKMSAMVGRAVKACLNCEKMTSNRPVDHAQYQPPAATPFWKLYLDCQGMPKTVGGGGFLIEARCSLTGFVEAAIITRTKATGATRFLRDCIVYRYGVPHEIVVDGGSEFKAEFKGFCDRTGINHILTASYNPKANGIVENGHYPIVLSLAKLTNGAGTDWRSYLQLVLFADRTSVRASHGYTPFYLVYGYDPITLIESKTPTWRILHWEDGMSHEELQDTRIRALQLRDEDVAAAVAAVTKFRRKRASDRDHANRFRLRAGGDAINIGDMVLVWDSLRAVDMSYRSKLAYRWEGPYVVRECGSKGNFKLAQLDGALITRNFNRDLLRKVAKDEDGVWQDVEERWWQEKEGVRSGGGEFEVNNTQPQQTQKQRQTTDRMSNKARATRPAKKKTGANNAQPQGRRSERLVNKAYAKQPATIQTEEEHSSDDEGAASGASSSSEHEPEMNRRIRDEIEIILAPPSKEYRQQFLPS